MTSLQPLEKEGLSQLFSSTLVGPKLNLAGLAKLQKARQHNSLRSKHQHR